MMERIAVLMFVFKIAIAMMIPEDTEMLEGYGFAAYPESSIDDEYFEARSLSTGPLYNSVRNKRAIEYDAKESNGYDLHRNKRSLKKLFKLLRRHHGESSEEFADEAELSLYPSRKRRSAEAEKNSGISSQRLPTPMKLTKSSDGNNRDSPSAPPSAAALVGKFARSPFEYSKVHHEEDSMAMDTSSVLNVNEGIKSRTPRVNFVTQQKKSLDHDDTKASSTKSEFYKTPPLLHNSKESTAASENERYPERTSSTTKPDYKNRDANRDHHYDDRYIEDMYPPPPQPPSADLYDPIDYNAPYSDPYVRRFPYSGYNGYYSGNRYDISDYRDYPPMYGNEIDSRYYMRTDINMMPPPPSSTLPRKRMIYYAYLPEVVRSPPTVGRYRSYDRYDSYYPDYYNNYEASNFIYRRPLEKSFKSDYRTSRPMKSNDDTTRNSSSFKEKRFNNERSYDDNELAMHTYVHRRPSEYDSFYY